MEHPSKLEKNLEGLLIEIGVQKSLREEMKRRGRRGMDSCLQKLEDKERELDDIQKELSVLKTGFHPNKFNARLNLNKRVIEILKVVEEIKESKTEELLKEDCTDEPDSVETFIMEQERGKPRRYSYEKLMLSFDSNYTIGEGGFGKVYKGKIDGIEVAIKVLKENAGDVLNKQFTSEVRTVFSTSHRHLVKLLGFCFHPKMKALVYEYMENGSLDKILYKNNRSMHWETLFDIAIGTGKGIAYLHESCDMPMIHFDIKAANVLLDSKHSPKLTDFGLSKMYKKDTDHVSQSKSIGTHGYAAPEVCLGQRVLTYKCDIYSYGMLLFEVLRRKQIRVDEDWYPGQVWRCFSNGELDRLITNCGIEKKDKKKATTLCKAALWCTQVNPDNRPPMSTVVKVLEDAMDLSLPINPDPNNFLSSTSSPSSEVPRSLPSEAVSPALWSPVESVFGMEESSRHKKFASTSDMRTPVYLKENTTRIESSKSTPDILPSLFNDLEDRFEKVSISPEPGSSKETELEVLGMHDRKIYKGKLEDETPRNRNVQSQKKMTHTEKASNFSIRAEAIPSIQKEPKEHYKNASSSIKTRSSKDRDSEAMLKQFEMRCPPGGKNSVIVYTTAYPYGKPSQDTNQVLLRLNGEKIQYEKRDIHADSRYQDELKKVLGKMNIQVPVVFVKGRLIGGAGELDRMNENGVLETLFHGIPKRYSEENDSKEDDSEKDDSEEEEKEVQREIKETSKIFSNLANIRSSKKQRASGAMLEKVGGSSRGESSVTYKTTTSHRKPSQNTSQVRLIVNGEEIHL